MQSLTVCLPVMILMHPHHRCYILYFLWQCSSGRSGYHTECLLRNTKKWHRKKHKWLNAVVADQTHNTDGNQCKTITVSIEYVELYNDSCLLGIPRLILRCLEKTKTCQVRLANDPVLFAKDLSELLLSKSALRIRQFCQIRKAYQPVSAAYCPGSAPQSNVTSGLNLILGCPSPDRLLKSI